MKFLKFKLDKYQSKLYKGTDPVAYKKASKGKTPELRSKIYYKEKAKNEKKFTFSKIGNDKKYVNIKEKQIKTTTINNSIIQRNKFRYRKTIIDELRNYRSSKIVSKVCDVLATTIIKTTGDNLNNKDKNILRSTISFVASEVFNKVFEEQREFIEKVKLYIKMSKYIVRIVVWIDERTKELKIDNEAEVLSINNLEYKNFLNKYPTVDSYYKSIDICLREEEIMQGKKCFKMSILKDKNIKKNKKSNAPNFCEYYNYCHGIEK